MKRHIKYLLKQTLYGLGFEIVPRGTAKYLVSIETLKQIFSEHRIDTVLDVGGNLGQYGDYLRKEIGFDGRIVSFEPSPDDFDRLSVHANNDPSWEAINTALGENEGRLPFNVARASVFSSFLRPTDEHVVDQDNIIAQTIVVDVVPLDALIPSLGLDLGRTYPKVDTQGFDLSVLRGARQSLKALPAFQTELSFLPIYEGMPDLADALRELRAFGFDVAAFNPVNSDRGRIVEADCVMLNRALLV